MSEESPQEQIDDSARELDRDLDDLDSAADDLEERLEENEARGEEIEVPEPGHGDDLNRQMCIRDSFALEADEDPFDLVFAVRVGALDGRHPAAGERALGRIAAATTPSARLFIDGGRPLRELRIPR
jgi:hypothetical protein